MQKFLNAVWLVSTVKEWMIRSFGMSNASIVMMAALDVSRNGVTTPIIHTFVMSIVLANLFCALFIAYLYRQYRTGALTARQDLLNPVK